MLSLHKRSLVFAGLLVLFIVGCSSKSKLRFTTTPATTAVAGVEYNYAAMATGGTGITYQLVRAPAGMTVSAAGLVSWTPTATQVGTHSVSLRAAVIGKSGTQDWTIAVAAAQPQLAGADLITDLELVFHINWRDSIESAGQVPEHALLTASPDSDSAYGFSWADELGVPDLVSENFPDSNTWHNPETRAAFVEMVRTFVALFRPRLLFLGNRTDPFLDPDELDAWLGVLEEARTAAMEASPETAVLSNAR